MKKKVIARLEKLIDQVKALPNWYYSEDDYQLYNSDIENGKERAMESIERRVENKNELYRTILAFFNAHLDNDSDYYRYLGNITFEPKNFITNTFNITNNEHWIEGKRKLSRLLDLLHKEWVEQAEVNDDSDEEKSKTKVKRQFLEKDIFSAPLFWTILTVMTGVSFFLGSYKTEYQKNIALEDLRNQKLENESLRKQLNENSSSEEQSFYIGDSTYIDYAWQFIIPSQGNENCVIVLSRHPLGYSGVIAFFGQGESNHYDLNDVMITANGVSFNFKKVTKSDTVFTKIFGQLGDNGNFFGQMISYPQVGNTSVESFVGRRTEISQNND